MIYWSKIIILSAFLDVVLTFQKGEKLNFRFKFGYTLVIFLTKSRW